MSQKDEKIEIHIFLHGVDQSGTMQQLAEIKKILGEQVMPTINDLKSAVTQAASDVVAQVQAAVTKETADVVAQIQAIPVGTALTQSDIDGIVSSVLGIGTAAATSIDSISVNDGAGGTVVVPPPPPPPANP